MNIVFFGSSDFSMPPLEAVYSSSHRLVGVVTVPAAEQGRGRKLRETEVYEWARGKKVPVWTPERLRDEEFQKALRNIAPDLFVVASYGKILPQVVLDIPKRFCLNVHPSLLPRFRGAAPINWQIMEGESHCGVTFFRMDAGMDSGDILWQKSLPLCNEETAEELSKRLAEESAGALPEILDQISQDCVHFTPQDSSKMTLAPKLKKEDGEIDWTLPAQKLHNRVRGLLPWPCASTLFRGEAVRILRTSWSDEMQSKYDPGTILGVDHEDHLRVATGKGFLFILRIQRSGKQVISAKEFANGVRLQANERFGKAKVKESTK